MREEFFPPRGDSPSTSASRFRGDGVTHTLALQLQQQAQKLKMMEASPSSTSYKAQRLKVTTLMNDSERHFLAKDVDQSYDAELGKQIEEAEHICEQKDHKLDVAQKAEKEVETQKKDLLAILPKGLGQKFSCDAGSWPSFRRYFVSIIKNLEPTVVAASMKQLIDCPKL